MNSKYTAPEVITVGNAGELIRTLKWGPGIDEGLPIHADNDLDD